MRQTGPLRYSVSIILATLLAVIPVLAQSPSGGRIVVAETFDGLGPDGFPPGWSLKQWFGGGHDVQIISEGGRSVLRLASRKNSFGIYKKMDFNIKDYPILTWRWKVTRLPEGGDVRDRRTDDQAAQVYVMFPRFPTTINTRLVGYIWENKTPLGLQVTSKKSSNTRYIVLQSGPEKLDQWIEERRNVDEDYRRLFGEVPPQVGGVTLMIDSDDTQSSAESFFDRIQFEKP